MTLAAPAPFGRGASAPLDGRTILQIVSPSSSGGDANATLAVASALAKAGARALVACESREFASELQAVGGLHIPFPSGARNPVGMTLNARRLNKLLAAEQVDLVHARSRVTAWEALRACRKPKRAVVTTLQADGGKAAARTSFERADAEGDLVIAPSQFAAERSAELHPGAMDRIRIVRPGLDFAKISPDAVSHERVAAVRQAFGAAPHERIVLAPSRLVAARGAKVLIEAAARLQASGVADLRFILAGEAPKSSFARELDALAATSGVKAICARTGPPADRPAAYLAAAAVVFPALDAEGGWSAVLEAAAMGALVIVSDVGPASEMVAAPPRAGSEERAGWLVPPGDPAALAEAIEAAAMLRASAREAIRRRARAGVIAAYGRDRMTRDTLKVYAEALER